MSGGIKFNFTVVERGNVGVTTELEVKWEDDKGNEGKLDFGLNYQPGDAVPFDSGLSLMLGEGELLAGDKFEISATTATVREAKDLVLARGNSKVGVWRSGDNNMVEDLVPGLWMEILILVKNQSQSQYPITRRWHAKASSILLMLNTFNANATEVTIRRCHTNSSSPVE